MSLGCDITSLDSLVFDTPVESNTYFEKDAAAELDLWSNAKFTFDVKPGVGIYDDEKSSSPTPAQLEFSGLDPVTYDTLANYLDYELPKQQLEQQQSKPSLKRIQPRPLAPAPVPPVAATRQVLLPKPSAPLSPVADPNQLLAALLSTATCPGSPSSKKADSVAGVKRPLEKAGDGVVVDDDKRRRNTAASARFRIKKKMREQAMEQSVREMSTKSEQLQERVDQLESEIKFLRNLLLDKVASNKQQQQQQ
ncbi:Putative Regulatory protein cys-3 [Rhizopus microsporus]|nr:Putative Regulatory protein cys-3 [Rhizopus microsporus]